MRLHGSAHFLVQISEFLTNHHIMRAHDSLTYGSDRVAFLSNLSMKVLRFYCSVLTLSGPGFYGVPWPRGGGGRKVPAARNSKTIHGIERKLGRVVENHKLIKLV